jgi:hypothetical protein
MSYDIYLNHPVTGEVLETEASHNLRGGTYAVGGTTEAWLNVTYNYSKFFYSTMGEAGIRTIYGMTGAASLPILRSTVSQLGDDVSKNYWDATEGNAKCSLLQLIALAEMRPDGVWQGD